MPQTGEISQASAIYRSTHCGHSLERSVPEGQRFPPCTYCKTAIVWTIVPKTQIEPQLQNA
jgi:hypothetical protein